jgi:hypothetical protein
MTPEERWVVSTPEAMAAATIASWSERVEFVIEDLLVLPATSIVAEGPGFFPSVISPLITRSNQAIWLVPSEAFKRASAARREKPGDRHLTSDPERATRNIIERDLIMGELVRREAESLGLTVLTVDGSRDLEAMAAAVASHFGFD